MSGTTTSGQLYAAGQGTVYAPNTTTETNNAASGSDAQVNSLSAPVLAATGASSTTGLLQDPEQAAAFANTVKGYASPYLSSLQAMFGGVPAPTQGRVYEPYQASQQPAANVAKGLDQFNSDIQGPGSAGVRAALTAGNQTLANNLTAYAPALQKQLNNFVPGNVDTFIAGSLSSALKYYLGEGTLTNQELSSIPFLQQNPIAMSIAQTLNNVVSNQTLGTAYPSVTTGAPAPTASPAAGAAPGPYGSFAPSQPLGTKIP